MWRPDPANQRLAARKVGPNGMVVATENSPAMLQLARKRAKVLNLTNVKFIEPDDESVALDENDFDAGLCRAD